MTGVHGAGGAAMLTHAGDLWGRGFSVIPLDHPAATTHTDPKKIGKVPALPSWTAYQHRVPTLEEVGAWFGNGTPRNIGIVTGEVSGVVVVDCDDENAIAWADAHLPPSPMRTRTAKGEHRFYRHPGGTIRNQVRLRTGSARIAVDVRADGGYVVGPGSVHVSGFVYAAIGDWSVPTSTLPRFDPAWLDIPSVKQEPRRVTPDRDRRLERARAYLAKVPGAIEGQGGDQATFVVACKLVRGFDLSDADAFDLLSEWNAGCVPPWSASDLRDKIAGARKYGDEPIGGRAAERPAAGAHVGEPDAGVQSDPLSEAGAAERFAREFGDALRFDYRRGRWLVWDLHRWKVDADGQVIRLGLAFAREWQRTALEIADRDTRQRVCEFAFKLERRAMLDNVLGIAKALKPLADAGDAWDQDPWLLGVPNGVVDLRTGALRPGRRDDLITFQTTAAYDPDAQCPRFTRAMTEWFPDPALAEYVRLALGYSVTGLTTEQVFFCCFNRGSGGKTTLLRSVEYPLGAYAYDLPFSAVELATRAAIPSEIAALEHRRFVTASEANDRAKLNEARLKVLTGGDIITARYLHEEWFSFEPSAKLWLAFNHKPVVNDDSSGFWRRIRLLPFERTFPRDAALGDALRHEAPGILAWLIRGGVAWLASALEAPPSVCEATDAYRQESDLLGRFITEACDEGPAAEALGAELYADYLHWAAGVGLTDRERLTAVGFGRKMAERFRRVRRHVGPAYVGIGRRGV